MDDLTMVRELYGEPAPASPQLKTRIRNSVTSAPRRRFRYGIGGLVAVGAATALSAAGVAIVVNGQAGGRPGHGGALPAPRPTELTAQNILLAAAETAEKEPIGRYWRVDTTRGQTYHTGPADGGYNVVGYTSEEDQWTARSEDDPDALYVRDLGARPLTAVDKAAWQKAGSPTTWRVWSNDHYATLSTTPGATFGAPPGDWQSETTSAAQKKKNLEDARNQCPPKAKDKCLRKSLTWDELVKAYSEPGYLKQLLFPPQRADGMGGARAGVGPDHQALNALTFLTDSPAPPQARAEAYKLLAGVPGIRAIGSVKDVTGRTGIGLATRAVMQEGSGTVFDLEIILDPQTYKVLAWERVVVQAGGSMKGMRPGTVLSYEIYQDAGWTNDSPHHA